MTTRNVRWPMVGVVSIVFLLAPFQFAFAQQAPPPQGRARRTRPQGPQAPFWAPLPQEHQKYVDQVLDYWEHRSSKIERYRCQFRRWTYDPVFGPKDPNVFKSYSEGVIKYAAPDKGMFQVEKVLEYAAPAEQGGKPQYVERSDSYREHWVCDGQSIFQHDYQKKQLIELKLPPELQGKGIADSPLPFLFAADKQKIKQRYWIRSITPENAEGEYWLEAYPKMARDAANYLKVHVIIDQQDYLPKGLVIFDRNYDPRTKAARTTYLFENREWNWNTLGQKLNLFHKAFYEPQTPSGWKKVVKDYEQPAPPQNAAAPLGSPSSAGASSPGRSPSRR